MKKTIFATIIALSFIVFNTPANADMPIKDYMSYEFLDTQGYSGDMLRLVEINKAKTFGEQLPSRWSPNKIVRGWQKFWAYFDPAQEYGDFGEHDIKMHSSPWDY